MRIIAGSAGGISLKVPKHGVRPTMDSVKAAIFSSLGDRVPEATVLDLFSGSGGLGIEALSRGAAELMFVEKDRSAVAAIRDNLSRAGLIAVVVEQDAFAWLPKAASQALTFDLIIADPPYHKNPAVPDPAAQLLKDGSLPCLLAENGLLVLETGKRLDQEIPATWELLKHRKYGETHVHFFQWVASS